MFRSFLTLFAITLGAAAGSAQVLVQEDFENGIPPGWSVSGSGQAIWHAAAAGECGAVTTMAAYNAGPAACNYVMGGFAVQASMVSTPFLITGAPPYEFSFDYILDIDATGSDHVAVRLYPDPSSGLPTTTLYDETQLLNDNLLHHEVTWVTNTSYAQTEVQLQVLFTPDGIGDLKSGFLVDNFRLSDTPLGTPYCFGDGSGAACPCGNNGALERGCANSAGAGAELIGIGSPSVSTDNVLLRVSGLPPGEPALMFQGDNAPNGGNGLVFGEGLLCATNNLVRFGVSSASGAGMAEWGPGLAAHGGWTVGQTQYFQVWYRDPVGSPCGLGSNTSSAMQITWIP